MMPGWMGYVLGAMNGLSFLVYSAAWRCSRRRPKRPFDGLLTVLSVLGGSLGILLSMALFDRKAEKENMMLRVLSACMLVIHTALYLFFRREPAGALNGNIGAFLMQHSVLRFYLIGINVIALAAFGWDKLCAIRGRRRIRIVTLLALAFLGGSVGTLMGMYGFRHKTQKNYFTRGVPLMLMMQAVVLFVLMNI